MPPVLCQAVWPSRICASVMTCLPEVVTTWEGMGGTCRYTSTPLQPRTPKVTTSTTASSHHNFLYSRILRSFDCLRSLCEQHFVLDRSEEHTSELQSRPH